jgi:imidazolonepropionase-like amidohydrolase
VLGLGESVGRIAPGFRGDVVLFDQPSLAHLPYHVGSPNIQSVIVGGKTVAAH